MNDEASKDLHPYMWQGYGEDEWSILVFARTAREAKLLGWRIEPSGGVDYIDARAHRIRFNLPYIMSLARNDKPHAIDDPPLCNTCEQWGSPIHGDTCEGCE